MRPVNKGAHPSDANGALVVFRAYADAAPYLVERLGRYCSYCERNIQVGLAVEHVIPKIHAPSLEKDWENFLLACANCNSHKGDQLIQRHECLWPDTDDTFSAFTYEPSGAIKVSVALDQELQTKAHTLLALVGLNKSPDQATAADYRHRDRLEQWGKANVALDLLKSSGPQDRAKVQADIITLAADGYSIWVTVFRSEPAMLDALAKKYPGTKTSWNCR